MNQLLFVVLISPIFLAMVLIVERLLPEDILGTEESTADIIEIEEEFPSKTTWL